MGQPLVSGDGNWRVKSPLPVCQLGDSQVLPHDSSEVPTGLCLRCPQRCSADSPPPSLGWSSLLVCSPPPVPHPHFLGSFPQIHGIEASSNASLVGRNDSPVLFSDHVPCSCLFISLIFIHREHLEYSLSREGPPIQKGIRPQACS